MRPGEVDRDEVAARVVRVLSAGARCRSTWNDFDVRGVAEEVIAGRNVIADRAVLRDLAEDITRRARARCLTVVHKPVSAHVRHLTSQEVLDLERDIHGRLAVRGAFQGVLASLAQVATVADDQGVDRGQIDGVRAIASTDAVVLVEGAAGTGKSTMLAAANTLITQAGHRKMVVAPSRRLHLTDMTDAAALYVGMTRGRRSNTAHIVARTYDQAREQWVAASGRDRADVGVEQAGLMAIAEAATYGSTSPQTRRAREQGSRSRRHFDE